MGSEGAAYADQEGNYGVYPAMKVDVVDTTGAGDAFWSGFYTGITKCHNLKKSLELGFATSAYKLKYTGAIAHLPKIEEIKNMYNL